MLHTVLQMIEGGHAHRRRHRPRHRVVPQRPVAGLQDRRRHRAGAAGAVPSARGGARGDGRRGLADGRARGRRRARVRRAHRRRRRARGEGLHLDARQGSRAVRRRRPRGAGGPSRQGDPGRRRSAREVRRRPAADPGFLALVGDCADGYPGIAGIGAAAARLINRYGADRGLSARRARRATASWRCCSRTWRRCGRTRRCSPMSTSCAGRGRPRRSRRWRSASATAACSSAVWMRGCTRVVTAVVPMSAGGGYLRHDASFGTPAGGSAGGHRMLRARRRVGMVLPAPDPRRARRTRIGESVATWQGGTGSSVGVLDLVNTSDTPCVLKGIPTVRLLRAAHAPMAMRQGAAGRRCAP